MPTSNRMPSACRCPGARCGRGRRRRPSVDPGNQDRFPRRSAFFRDSRCVPSNSCPSGKSPPPPPAAFPSARTVASRRARRATSYRRSCRARSPHRPAAAPRAWRFRSASARPRRCGSRRSPRSPCCGKSPRRAGHRGSAPRRRRAPYESPPARGPAPAARIRLLPFRARRAFSPPSRAAGSARSMRRPLRGADRSARSSPLP